MPVVRVVRYSNGKLRAGSALAFPRSDGKWSYSNPVNRFFAAGPVRDEILAALKQAGSKHEYYTISLLHFIVLYPDYITREDLLTSISASSTSGSERFYSLWAELPFGDNKKRVQLIVDPKQSEVLVTSLDDLEAHVL
jgi:hypothetical protein